MDDVPGIRSMIVDTEGATQLLSLRGCARTRGNHIECLRLEWPKAAQRERPHVGDALRVERVDQRVIGTIRDIVEVLHANHGRNSLGFSYLLTVSVLTPRWRTRPSRCISASAPNESAMEPGSGRSIPATRRITTSSASSPRLQRMSGTAERSSPGVSAGGQPPHSSSRAPTFVTMCRSEGFGTAPP